MQNKTLLTYEQYRRICIQLFIRSNNAIAICGSGVVLLGYAIVFSLLNDGDNNSVFIAVVYFLFSTVVYPASYLAKIKRTFTNNARVTEEITYELTPERLIYTASTFKGERIWAPGNIVLELKDCFIIYEKKGSKGACILSKHGMTPDEIDEMRTFFRSLKIIKLKLLDE